MNIVSVLSLAIHMNHDVFESWIIFHTWYILLKIWIIFSQGMHSKTFELFFDPIRLSRILLDPNGVFVKKGKYLVNKIILFFNPAQLIHSSINYNRPAHAWLQTLIAKETMPNFRIANADFCVTTDINVEIYIRNKRPYSTAIKSNRTWLTRKKNTRKPELSTINMLKYGAKEGVSKAHIYYFLGVRDLICFVSRKHRRRGLTRNCHLHEAEALPGHLSSFRGRFEIRGIQPPNFWYSHLAGDLV